MVEEVVTLPDGRRLPFVQTDPFAKVEARFFFGLCPVSLETAHNVCGGLKTCSACLSVAYRGKEEQKTDWKRHKKICNVLRKIGACHQDILKGIGVEIQGSLEIS